jgi:hypothetical protein
LDGRDSLKGKITPKRISRVIEVRIVGYTTLTPFAGPEFFITASKYGFKPQNQTIAGIIFKIIQIT